jgi:hypothetical protein
LQPENIVRASMFKSGEATMGVVATKQPFDRKKILDALAPNAEQTLAGNKPFFQSANTGNAVYFLDDRTMVTGPRRDLSAFLTRADSPERNTQLDRALLASQQGALLVVQAGQGTIRSIAADQKMQNGPLAPLIAANEWQIMATCDKPLLVELRAVFATNDEAQKAAEPIKIIVAKLRELGPFYKANMEPFLKEQSTTYPGAKNLAPQLNGAIDAADEALKAVRVETAGNEATARIEINSSEPVTTAVLLLTLMPRPAKDNNEPKTQ